MATKINFACPECGATLSVSDRSKLGKKIKCPKCQEVFIPDVPEEEDLDEVQLIDDDDDDEPSPRRKSGGGGKSKNAASSGGSSKGLLIGGGVVALLAIVGAGLFFSGALGGNNAAPVQNVAQQPVLPPTTAPAETPAAAPAQPAPPAEPAKTEVAATTPAPVKTEPIVATPVATTPVAVPAIPAPKSDVRLSLPEKMLSLRWMPVDTELIVHAKISDILQAPLLKGPLGGPMLNNLVSESKKTLSIGLDEIETVTVGLTGLVDSMNKQPAIGTPITAVAPGQLPTSMPNSQMDNFLLILKTKQPVSLGEFAKVQPGSTIKEKEGKEYIEWDQSISGLPGTIGSWSPNPNILIVGTLKEMLAAMERGETVTPRPEFQSIDQTQHFVVAAIIPDLETDPRFKEFESIPFFSQTQAAIKPYGLKMVNFGITLKGGFNLHISALSKNDEGAKATKTGLDSNISLVKTMFDGFKQTAPPLLAELGDMLLTNLKVEEKGNLIRVSTNVPDSAKDKLEQLPALVTVMAMSGAFGGPAAPPGSTMSFSGGKMVVTLPGESDSFEPKTVEGLDDGLKITVKTAWNPVSVPDSDGKPMQPIDIIVDLTGPDVEKICASSDIVATSTKLEGAGKLKRSKSSSSADPDSATMFRPFDAKDESIQDHPPMTLRVKFTADPPSTNARKLAAFEGSFKYLTFESSKVKTIEDAPEKASRVLKDEELKAADVKLRRNHSNVSPMTLSLSAGKDFFIGKVKGAPGDPLIVTEFDKDRTVQKVYPMEKNGKFQEGFELTFTLFEKVDEHEVKFRFEDIPLPSPESKPMPTQISEADAAAAANPAKAEPNKPAGKPPVKPLNIFPKDDE